MWRSKSDPWGEEETDRFYEALSMFGTDFFIISTLFPGKTRKMIKAKFVREERLDPPRINDALLGRPTGPKRAPQFDLNHYARETGRDVSVYTKYEDAEHAERVIRESMKERQREMEDAIREEGGAGGG